MQTRRNIFLWTLYDFANSVVSVVFFLYFSQWVVIDRGISDFRFNLTFTTAAVLLLFTAPLTGVLLDKFLRRITGLRYATLFTVIFYGLCALSAVYNRESDALIFFTLGFYSYLLSFTFYTPLINDIAPVERRGRISGFGIAANYLGQLIGLIIALPFSNKTFILFNAAPRAETLLPSVVIFSFLSLPMLLFFREPKRTPGKISLGAELKNTFQESKTLFIFPSVAFFLASYFLFNDAILTVINNFPIAVEQIWGVSDTTKTYIALGIITTSAIGGVFSGMLADRFGHKRTLMWILVGWLFIMPLIALLTNFTLFVISTILLGFWLGANWTVSRSVMSYVAPPGKHNLAFAYFGLAERASSFIGPIVWGLIVSNLVSMGSYRYRIATLAITGFILLGLFTFSHVRDDRKSHIAV
ncbi:MAG: MFS transporter, UMF1 family [Parcubacteria group bacterium Gr01-1014_33]|nr:MAG: MFS transporter, UMF1 family [Parcubacteria group bacterium Gr01-1014_33]